MGNGTVWKVGVALSVAAVLLVGGVVAVVAGNGHAASAGSGGSTPKAASALHPELSRPHPSPIPITNAVPRPSVYSSHWWSGTDYGGATRNTTQAKMTLQIPDAVPSSSEFYYVLLSTWDNAGSYDQIGIANDYGTWGWTWSYTSNCAGSYNYTPNQMALSPGGLYTFTMDISVHGLQFAVEKAGKWVGHISAKSGGTHFIQKSMYTCSTGPTYYDYTDYEEIYTTVQSVPSFEFLFTANQGNNRSITNWSTFAVGSGSGGTIAFKGSTVKIENQGFTLSFVNGIDSVSLVRGTTSYATNVSATHLYKVGKVTLTAGGLPSGMSVTFAPSKAAPTFIARLNFTISSTIAKGSYTVSITATDSAAHYTYLDLTIVIT